MRLVINRCFGGFGLSDEAFEALLARGWRLTAYGADGNELDKTADIVTSSAKYGGRYHLVKDGSDLAVRSHPDLVAVVEQLGERANGPCAKLAIIEVPDGVELELDDYDGKESVRETHRSWP